DPGHSRRDRKGLRPGPALRPVVPFILEWGATQPPLTASLRPSTPLRDRSAPPFDSLTASRSLCSGPPSYSAEGGMGSRWLVAPLSTAIVRSRGG
ncbi:MAG: hypothetical protein J6N54_00415, partial [Bacteroidales bacterium]|nr:hypothetical protein [Bacteroidales bacterium]